MAVTVSLAYDHVLVAWGSWVIAFTVSTAAVRCVIATQKGRPAGKEVATAFAATLVAGALTTYSVMFLSTFPYLFLGWTLIISGVLTASAAVILERMI